MSNEHDQHLTKRERRELRREEQTEAQARDARKRTVKKAVKALIALFLVGGIVGGLAWLIAKSPKTPESDIVTRIGLHWHPELSIIIKGKKEVIPAEIGLGAIEQPIHTHDAMGVIHLEVSGLVRKDDLRLARFFKIWGKRFDQNCIFDFCNGAEGTVKFFVNGQPNEDFEQYVMRDGDKMEIRFE